VLFFCGGRKLPASLASNFLARRGGRGASLRNSFGAYAKMKIDAEFVSPAPGEREFTQRGVLIAADRVNEPLYAIVPVFNPWRWKSRIKHTERALKHFHDSGATIVLVEIAFNRREFVFSDFGLDGVPANCGVLGSDNRFRHRHIQLRTKDELWLKENAINLGVASLPHDWQQVCWLDSDVHFVRPNWVGECIQKLQHYAFLQMFSHARDLGTGYEMLPEDYPHANGMGFVEAWRRGIIHSTEDPCASIPGDIAAVQRDMAQLQSDVLRLENDLEGCPYYQGGAARVWPGLAWACTRKAWDDVGGLFDAAIWGGGDWHMSHALIEKTEGMMRLDLHRNYKKLVMQWYQRCRTHIRRNVGVMEGSILHHWHGKKSGRGYNTKHALLAKVGFDPPRHLKRDYQGLYQLHDDRSTAYVQLRDLMRTIARERNEDSIDM
jgi:hypothetical protein